MFLAGGSVIGITAYRFHQLAQPFAGHIARNALVKQNCRGKQSYVKTPGYIHTNAFIR
jgi:hypothetical protein